MLCLAASNLSMLDATAQQRCLRHDLRRSVFSPVTNRRHDRHARQYHEHALLHYGYVLTNSGEIAELLVAQVLLAYYHHASSDHCRFRISVWETVHTVQRYQTRLMHSNGGKVALQLWYRLCTSHRPSKPPSLFLDGEGTSVFGPNLALPDARDYLHLSCVLGMSSDDLIYDIIVKTIEIRSRLVVYRCTAAIYGISEHASSLGGLAHDLQTKLLGRRSGPDERAEAEASFVQGSHLLGLLETQRERLLVWEGVSGNDPLSSHSSTSPFQTHRNTMNLLYYHLCSIIFAATTVADKWPPPEQPPTGESQDATTNGVSKLCHTIASLDFTQSSTADVYTLSLAEVLLQLVLTYQSTALFDHVLDVIWPRIEGGLRGYEHSHLPTHLAKRTIALLAEEWRQGRAVFHAQLAVPENFSKLRLLDLQNPVELVIHGRHQQEGEYFAERKPLP
jgi:hypothetical protein